MEGWYCVLEGCWEGGEGGLGEELWGEIECYFWVIYGIYLDYWKRIR